MLTSGLFLDGHAYNGTTLFQKFLKKRSASSTTMAETAAGSQEPVVEQPAADGADQPGQDLQNQDGEAPGDGKVIERWLGSNCYNVDCRERWLLQALGALGAWEV